MAIKELKPYLKNIADTLREVSSYTNLFDKDNITMLNTSYVQSWGTTETGFYIVTKSGTGQSYGMIQLPIPTHPIMQISYELVSENTNISDGSVFCDSTSDGKSMHCDGYKTKSSPIFPSFSDFNGVPGFRFWIYNPDKQSFKVEFKNFMYICNPTTPNPEYVAYNNKPIPINAQAFSKKIQTHSTDIVEKEKERLINSITCNGLREVYTRAFNEQNFAGYDFEGKIKPTSNSPQMFYNYGGIEYPIGVDLSAAPPGTSSTNGTSYALYSYNQTKFIPDMGLPIQFAYTNTYAYSTKIKEIEIMRISDTTTFSGTFANCSSLHTVHFEGTIGKSIGFPTSPLLVDTMKHIIDHLKDYSQDTTNINTQTLTFTDSCWTALEASGVSPLGGTWKEYVQSLGWNV